MGLSEDTEEHFGKKIFLSRVAGNVSYAAIHKAGDGPWTSQRRAARPGGTEQLDRR